MEATIIQGLLSGTPGAIVSALGLAVVFTEIKYIRRDLDSITKKVFKND